MYINNVLRRLCERVKRSPVCAARYDLTLGVKLKDGSSNNTRVKTNGSISVATQKTRRKHTTSHSSVRSVNGPARHWVSIRRIRSPTGSAQTL